MCRNLNLDAKPEDVVLDCILGDDGTIFVVFSGEKYADLAIQNHHIKPCLEPWFESVGFPTGTGRNRH